MGKPKRPSGPSVKRLNRRLNKLAKKGKLKKNAKEKLRSIQYEKKSKKRQKQEKMEADWKQNREIRTAEKDEEDTLPLDMIDPELGIDGFVNSKLKEADLLSESKKRKRKSSAEESGPDFETHPRTFSGVADMEYRVEAEKVKHLLPVKTNKGKIVTRFMEVSAEETEVGDLPVDLLETAASEGGLKEFEEKEFSSVAEMYAERWRLLSEYKEKIASFSNQLVQNPEEKVHKLKDLLLLGAGEVEPLVSLTVRKLATVSMLNVFLNIIPGYRIRERTEEEQSQKLKKETKHLVEFEESLLRNYRKYLQQLESLIPNVKKKKAKEPSEHSNQTLGKIAATCLAKLLESHPHFNYRTNIIMVLVPLAGSRNTGVNQLCCESLGNVMKADKAGDCALEVVKSINKCVKENTNSVFPGLLATFTALQIKEVDRLSTEEKKQENIKKMKKKDKLKRLSKKERKYQKQLGALEKELKETEAEENRNIKRRTHTKIMEQVFSTYFRVLKKNKESGALMEPVLEGLSKFAHLINVEFFDDLIGSLLEMAEGRSLKTLESLYCVRTAFTILSGEGQSLNIDPYSFYQLLFSLLPKMGTERNCEMQRQHFSLCFQCLDLMFVERRAKVSLARVAGFTKRLSLLCLILPPDLAIGCLATLRKFFVAHPKLDVLLDEEGVGSGKFLPHLDDPEHCNALTSDLRELNLLRDSCSDERVKAIASHILAGEKAKLTRTVGDIIEKKPWELIEYSESAGSTWCSSVPLSKKALAKRGGNVCLEIAEFLTNKRRFDSTTRAPV